MKARLEKMNQSEKYMAFQADEIMQAKAAFLKMKDECAEARQQAAQLEHELLRRIAGLESSLKHKSSAAPGAAGDVAALQQQLAAAQGQLSEVGTQLELALVKAESSRQESASKAARVRELEAAAQATSAKLNKVQQELAD